MPSALEGPFVVLVVPESAVRIQRPAAPALPQVVPEGRPGTVPFVAISTKETPVRHGQTASSNWALTDRDRADVVARLRALAAFIEARGEQAALPPPR